MKHSRQVVQVALALAIIVAQIRMAAQRLSCCFTEWNNPDKIRSTKPSDLKKHTRTTSLTHPSE